MGKFPMPPRHTYFRRNWSKGGDNMTKQIIKAAIIAVIAALKIVLLFI